MSLSYSVDKVDKDGREILTYGTKDFPIAFFDDDLVKVAVPWHWHDEFEVVIITEGIVNVKISNSELILKAGEGYFANGGILHSANLKSVTGHQHCLIFSPDLLCSKDDIIRKTYIDPVINNCSFPFVKLSPEISWQNKTLKLCENAWQQGAYEHKDYPLNVKADLSQVFALIIDHMDFISEENIYTGNSKKDESRIKKAIVFIENNYDSFIGIKDIAKSADISVSTCLRLFKDILCTTPIQYLINYRVQKAVEKMKLNIKKPISEAAYECGFSDAAYFNRRFKKIYGCTPTEYLSKINTL